MSDVVDQIIIPDKLYGRDRDIKTLLESFERISNGRGEVLLVPGTSGVGKTALVLELQNPVRDRNGFFITGKFDQYKQNIPYFAFRQALTELCRELQFGDMLKQSQFRADILKAIGNLGQVLVDLVPELEMFLGTQPPLEDISPQEARHRFAEVFRNFLKVICKPEHPLVLFIDDWQWADTASCELLRQMQVGITLRYLLVIVSFRDNEVGSGHPLMSKVNDMRSHSVPIETLHVNNITKNDIKEIVSDTLKPAIENIDELAEIIHNKTLGNPFFVRSFLSYLHEFNLIEFNKDQNYWQWSTNKVGGADLPSNVEELFVLKLRSLDTESQNIFSWAACLGNRFDIDTLSMIIGKNKGDCLASLFSDQAKDMLLQSEVGGDEPKSKDSSKTNECKFLHDRVQQAAYSLIEPAELPEILLKIGRLLLANLQPEQLSDRLFEVVSNLNAGYHLINEISEQVRVVELNIAAAHKAYAATAYRSALQSYRAANRFLEMSDFAEYLWRDRHELTMSLYLGLAECEFLEGDRNEAEKCIQQSVFHASSALEKAATLNILIVQYTLLARYPEAIKAGLQALAILGISLPEEDFEDARNDEISKIRQKLENQSVSSLYNLPVMSNPEMLMASKILITMGPPCYRSHQRLWGVIVPKVVNLTLQYGNIPQVGYSHTAFGGLLGWVDNDYTTAKEFGELATHLMTSKFKSATDQSVFYLMIGSSIRHWFKHLKYGTQDYTDAYEIGLRSGNLQYAAYAFGHNMYCRFYQGIPLPILIQESKNSLEFSSTRLNQWAIDLLDGGLNVFDGLSGENPDLNGKETWSEEEYIQRVDDHHNIQVLCIYKVLKTFSLLLFGHYTEALALSDETEPLIYTVGTQGLLPWAEHVFARLLILTALYSKADEKQQTKWRSEIDKIIIRLRIWADNCPENFEHKYLLAMAEINRIDGMKFQAIQYYDKAIEAAQAGNFLQWEGVANERASGFWLECGNELLAHDFWQQAYVCYNRWGALAKVSSMETEYRIYLLKNLLHDNVSNIFDEEQELEIKNVLIERQIQQLRNYSFQMQQSRLRIEATAQAEELSLAMQRLRVEVAERKQLEKEMRESEERFHSLFDNMSEGVALHELVYDGGAPVNYRIVDINNSYLKIIGGFRNQVIGKLSTDAYNTTTPPYLDQYIEVALNKQPIYFETYYQLMDKQFAISVIPWHQSGFATIFTDITERKQAEEAIRLKSEELQKNNAEKDKFFSIIAHDLRSPFNSFLGLTQIMAEELPTLSINEIQKIAISMKTSATNLYRLLENLLEWSLIQQGLFPFNPEVVQLFPIISESIELLVETAKGKSIEISVDVPNDLEVFADNNTLQTVIRNLVSNALKFTPKGGKITVSAKMNDDKRVEISVKDTGIGMDQSILDNLFRLDVNTCRKGTEGELSTGLGLLLCSDFIEKHGGKLLIESQEGMGSTFYFTIPTEE